MNLRRLLCWFDGHRWHYGIWNFREMCREGAEAITGRRCLRCGRVEQVES